MVISKIVKKTFNFGKSLVQEIFKLIAIAYMLASLSKNYLDLTNNSKVSNSLEVQKNTNREIDNLLRRRLQSLEVLLDRKTNEVRKLVSALNRKSAIIEKLDSELTRLKVESDEKIKQLQMERDYLRKVVDSQLKQLQSISEALENLNSKVRDSRSKEKINMLLFIINEIITISKKTK